MSMGQVTIRENSIPDRPRYCCCHPSDGVDYTVFGIVQGGETREEAVFWAERMASKNDMQFIRPNGWEDVVGALPPEADE